MNIQIPKKRGLSSPDKKRTRMDYRDLAVICCERHFSFLHEYHYFNTVTLLRQRSAKFVSELISYLDENIDNSTIANIVICEESSTLCHCVVNQCCQYICFSNDNDYSNIACWSSTHGELKEGKCKIPYYVLSDRFAYYHLYNHIFALYSGDLVRMDKKQIMIGNKLLRELHMIVRFIPREIFDCTKDVTCCVKHRVFKSLRLKFRPQMFPSLNVTHGLDTECSNVVRTLSSRLDNNVHKLADALKEIKVSFDASSSLNSVSSMLQDNAIKLELGVSEPMKELIASLKEIKVSHSLGLKEGNVFDMLLTKFEEATSGLNSFMDQNKGIIKVLVPVIIIAILIYLSREHKIKKTIIISVASLVAFCLFPDIKDLFLRIVERISGFASQSPFNCIDDVITLIFYTFMGRDIMSKGFINSFKHVKDYSRAKLGVSTFLKDSLNLIQSCLNHILDYFNCERYIFYTNESDLLGKYLDDTNDFVEGHSLDTHLTYEDGMILAKLETRYVELNKVITGALDRQKLYYAKQALDPYVQKKRASSWFGQSNRIEPIGIVFVGASHVGKTSVMQALIHEVTASVISDERLEKFIENPGSEIFSWNWERDHADGYNRQFNTVIDDIGCTVDVAGTPNNIYAALIKMINSTPYNLNMAELTSKADSFFSSELVWMTSNRQRWNLNSMFYNEAFINRLRISVLVKLKPGYAPPVASDTSYPEFEHLVFYLVSFDHEGMQDLKIIKEIGGYSEMRDYIIEAYWNNRRKGKDVGDNIRRIIERGKSLRPQMRVNLGDNFTDVNVLSGVLGKVLTLRLVSILGIARYVNVPLTKWINNYLTTKYSDFFYGVPGLGANEVPTEQFIGECSLNEILNRKPIAVHFLSKCTCPFCDPHSLLRNLKLIMENAMSGDYELPEEFCNIVWCLGFSTDADVGFFGQALFHFLYRSQYEEYIEKQRNSDNSLGEYMSGDSIDRDITRICENWSSSNPVYLCIHDPKYTMDNFSSIRDYTIFMAFCCAFYIKRLDPYIAKKNFKNKLKSMVCSETIATKTKWVFKYVPPAIRILTSITVGVSVGYLVDLAFSRGSQALAVPVLASPMLDDKVSMTYNGCWKNNHSLNVMCTYREKGSDARTNACVRFTVSNAFTQYILQPPVNFELLLEEKFSVQLPDVVLEFSFEDMITASLYYNKSNAIDVETKSIPSKFGIFIESDKWIITNIENSIDLISGHLLDLKKFSSQSSSGLNNTKGAIQRSVVSGPLKAQAIDISKYMSGYDKANRDIGKKVINRNVFILYVPNKNCADLTLKEYEKYLIDSCRSCSVLMLGGRVGIMNDHVRNYVCHALKNGFITNERPLLLVRASDPLALPHYWIPDVEKDFYAIDVFSHSDITVFKLPVSQFPEFTNIKKYFVTKDLPRSELYNGILYVPDIRCKIESTATTFRAGVQDYDDYNNGEVWLYPIATQEGDCGALLTISDKFSGSKKICGFHVAGDGFFRGASFPLFQEEVEAVLDFFKVREGLRVPVSDIEMTDNFLTKQGRYPYTLLGETNIPAIPFRSRIREAPLHDVGDITYVPVKSQALMVGEKLVLPAMQALWKNIPATQPLNIPSLKLLYDLMLQDYEAISVVDRERRLLTFEESVLGIQDDPYLRAMTRSSSSGLPYKIDMATSGLKGKQILFGKEEVYDLDNENAQTLRKDVEEEIYLMKQGTRNVIPYEVSEKDECLPKDKVAEGKIRLFAVNSTLGGCLKRIYGGQFRSWFAHNRIYNGSAIGINVYSLEWNQMIKYLLGSQEEGSEPSFIAMDVSKFDGSISRTWMYLTYRLVSKWYNFDEETKSVQWQVFESHMHSFHVFQRYLFERQGSQSSGDDYTALLNTITSQGYFWYACLLIITGSKEAVLQISDEELIALWKELRKSIRLMALGDDILVRVNPKSSYYGIITEKALIERYNLFGVNATTDSKEGTVYEYRFLRDVTFLKRRSHFDPDVSRYVGRLELTSILKSIQWMRDKDPHFEAYRLTLEHALEEFSLHPPDISERFVAIVQKLGKERVGLNLLRSDLSWLKQRCLARIEFF